MANSVDEVQRWRSASTYRLDESKPIGPFSKRTFQMPRKRVSLRCPTCKKLVLRDEPEFPFCSERCRVIDLGKWASGGYVISTPIIDPEEAGLEYRRNPGEDKPAQGEDAGATFGGHSKRRN